MVPNLHTIDNLVEDIYKNFNIKEPLNSNLQKVVQEVGGVLIEGNKTGIKKTENGFIIELKGEYTTEEKKIKVYELVGYLFIVMGYSIDKDIWKKSKFSNFQFIKNKPLLTYFAYSFMMPKTEFLRMWELCREDCAIDTVSISERYGVSLQTVSVRSKFLGLIK